MKKITKVSLFFLSLILTLVSLFYYMFLFQGKKEVDFLYNLQKAFPSSEGKVAISSLIENDWDQVCYVDSYTSDSENYGVNTNKINFYFALVFLHSSEVKKVLNFKPVSFDKKGALMPTIELNGQKFRFLSKAKDSCLSYDDAMLTASIIETGCCGSSNEIFFIKKR